MTLRSANDTASQGGTRRPVSENYTLQGLLATQRAAFLRDGIPDARTRIDRIDRLAALLLDNADEIRQALNDDFGTRPADLSTATDIVGCMYDLLHQRAHIRRWMKTERIGKLRILGLSQRIRHDPLGVVGVVGPWNFPLALTMVPAGAALAAGNRVLVRPSSTTPLTAGVVAAHAGDYFSIEELAVVTPAHGSGSDFSKLELDHLFFTGSPHVGASVAADAARNLTPVTLELGGKNPAVVDVSADLTKAAERVADSRMVNSGQVCLSPDYVFVPDGALGEFCDRVVDRWRSAYPTIEQNPQYTSIIDDKNFRRVCSLVDDSVAAGAAKRVALPPGETLPDADTRKIPPTLLTGVDGSMHIETEEIFGPVLVAYPYRELGEVIDHINRHSHPLAIYWYGNDNDRFERLQASTRSGAVCGNDFAVHLATGDLPFGGVGRSGMGSYHGRWGFATFTHARAVFHSRMPVSLASLMSAPFEGVKKRVWSAQLALFRGWIGRRRLGHFRPIRDRQLRYAGIHETDDGQDP
ncbi:aldehyde dehydrogenase family protein [Mycolicibacter longobardus]|uniref:Aldehyde dehydrogenase n=1 Tax=Mycolicibacter longobardus TaxID=1108812 RepID=A0A1X1YS33_9MYCO|nr:aldehyde dehydrogenase family protein [Mycolicibacter longobardus]MCV7383412.1 aldehyde dehydrogenase family protein [Mycolicibacter longobardus]ORW13801.1 aldehyde dehydrogenase [Mycolicibacter longobardus]